MDQPGRRRRSVQFLRSVGANAVANVAAAPLIYLLGAATGLFPQSRNAVVVAFIVFALIAGYLLTIAASVIRSYYGRELSYAGSLVALGVVLLTGTLTFDWNEFVWWSLGLKGLLSLVIGCYRLVRRYREMRASQAADRRIKGLHWFEWRQ